MSSSVHMQSIIYFFHFQLITLKTSLIIRPYLLSLDAVSVWLVAYIW